MEWWADAEPVLRDGLAVVWDVLSSWLAQRIYVIALSLAALGASLWGAYAQKAWLDGLTEDFFVVKFPGRMPTTEKGKARRAKRSAKTRAQRMRELSLRLGALFALGILAPAAFLYAGTSFYWWFDASHLPLALHGTAIPAATPGPLQLAIYVADQLLRGGFFDALEVFQVPVAAFTNNPKAYYYSFGVLAFHLYAEAFVIFGLSYVLRLIWLLSRVANTAKVKPPPPPILSFSSP